MLGPDTSYLAPSATDHVTAELAVVPVTVAEKVVVPAVLTVADV